MISKSIFLIAILFGASFLVAAQLQYPVIKNYGGVNTDIPGVSFKADKKLQYKVVIEIDSCDTSSTKVSHALDIASRYINLLALDGIEQNKRSVVVIFYHTGAYTVQNNEAYQRKYGRPNPNTDVFEQLEKAGVSFLVCGQSTVRRKIQQTEILPSVKIATSYLTATTTLQLKGYALLKL